LRNQFASDGNYLRESKLLINFEGSNSNNSYEEYENSNEKSSGKKKLSSIISLLLLIVGGTFLVQNTLAANISLNSGGAVEFGQGVAMTAACSGADSLIVTPNSEFTNASGSGAHYLKTITVTGIPVGCNGVDFNISVYDSTTSTALPMFGSTKSVATIWNNAGTFQGGTGYLGSTISSGSGTFTVTFTTPVALASNVSRLTIQSSNHAPFSCATDLICSVGDTSSSGGTVFYYSAAGFTETGTACASNCHYLEYAPLSWYPGNDDGSFNFSYNGASKYGIPVTTGTKDALGAGYNNTALIITAGDTQGAHARAKAYVGPYANTTGEWFIPSTNEMNAIWDSAAKSSGGFRPNEYHVSVQDEGSQRCKSINFFNRSNNSQGCTGANPYRARPIRAF
jgi:hypothetical protein